MQVQYMVVTKMGAFGWFELCGPYDTYNEALEMATIWDQPTRIELCWKSIK